METKGNRRSNAAGATATLEQLYEHADTRDLVALVDDAAELVRTKGEEAFAELSAEGSRWRQGEMYVFVLDPEGNMLVHPDPALHGHNVLDLKDVNGKPIIRGLIGAVTASPDKPSGWYHYEWPVPGGLLPRWKSSYVELVNAPSGKKFVVGCGVYNDRVERAFLVDMVTSAAGEVERRGEAAFELFRDPAGPFRVKDAYIFGIDTRGLEVFNAAFPNLEGRDLMEVTDAQGKHVNREMIELVRTKGSGWVDYMWPKPGESVPTQKSSFVTKIRLGDSWGVIGAGAYLADAPKQPERAGRMSAQELTALVREAAALLEDRGEAAFEEFARKGSKWFHDGTYLFVHSMDGKLAFHAAEPTAKGRDDSELRDTLGKPFVKMILDAARSPAGEGWVHYMYPEPGSLYPEWKSAFVKRVTFPSGEIHSVGCGVYNMKMDRAFIEDIVEKAAALVAHDGTKAFDELRDPKGPFVFMDTYVFVETPDGTELVNPAQPSLEGQNIADLKDATGRTPVRDEIKVALEAGSGWVDYDWYKPGDNRPARKQTFVRKVQSDGDTFVVGSGVYME